jgi:FtsX-like permease family
VEVVLAAVLFLLGARFRHRWRSWLALSLLIALVSGLVLAGVVAARRTATAFPRYLAAHGFDSFVLSPAPIPKIATLPGVSSATLVQLITGGLPACACSRPINGTDLTVEEVAPANLSRVVKLVAGRMPDQSEPDQVLASFTLAQDAGVHVGTAIRIPFYSPSQRGAVLRGAIIRPAGPAVTLRVVGIEASENEFPATSNAGYSLYSTRAFARIVNPKTFVVPGYLVRLRNGAGGLPRFQAQAQALGAAVGADEDGTTSAVESSIRPQVVGWWILAGLAALAGSVVIAQALSRQAAIEAESYTTLSALGTSRRQLVALGTATTLVVATAGAIGGVALAFLLSPLTPVGEARLADPSPGSAFDVLVLLPGVLAVVVVVAALGLWPTIKTAGTARPAPAGLARPSRIVALLADAGAPPSALIGVRDAVERGRGRAAVPVGRALLGSVVAVAALCATAVFGASLTHLTSTPALYGQEFDLEFTPDGPAIAVEFGRLLTGIERSSAISDITAGISGDVSINGRTVLSLAGRSVRGRLLLAPISGHLPDDAGQVALGTTTLRELGVHVGSLVRVTVPGPGGRRPAAAYRVVGTAVFPPDFGSAGLGTGAVFTLGALLGAHCPSGPAQQVCQLQAVYRDSGGFLVRALPGPRGRAALARLARQYPEEVLFPATPANLANFGQAVNFPLIFGAALVLFGVATLVHFLTVSVTRRRRETGLLKALGFVRRQVAFAVFWQTTTVALVGIVIGVPAGIVAGRLIWQAFAANLGVVPVPVVSARTFAVAALGTVILANVLAAGPALLAARARPATLLRTE